MDPGITPMSKVAAEFLNLLQKSTFDQVDASYDKDYFSGNASGTYFVSNEIENNLNYVASLNAKSFKGNNTSLIYYIINISHKLI